MPGLFDGVLDFGDSKVSKLTFTGTTGRSATNNNPLNLEYRPGSYQDKYGAELEPMSKSGKQRFAKFATMEDGYNAGIDQIKLDASRGHTLASFVNKFAPPHENPTDQIIQQYAKVIGVNSDTLLSEINPKKLMVPMLARESSTKIQMTNPQIGLFDDILKSTPAESQAFTGTLNKADAISALAQGGMFDDILQGADQSKKEVGLFDNIISGDVASVQSGAITETDQPTMMDPFAQAEVGSALSLVGKGLGWIASRPRELLLEPTIGAAYDKLAPLIGAPTDKGFVNVGVPADALVRPGEFGQVGGEPVEGSINFPAITPRELLMSGVEAKGLGLLSRIPAIRTASKEGTLTRFTEMRKPELLWDNPELGAVVYNKPYITKLDSTLGPVGTEVAGPVLREGHAVMSAQLADGKIRAPFSFGGKWKRDFGTSLKTDERILSELDDIAPGMKQEFWTSLKASENAGYRQTKIAEKELDELAVAAGGHEVGNKLGVIAISEREPYGPQALRNMGITDIPTATPVDRTIINQIKNKYYGLLERINEGRAASGLQPIPTDTDYVTLMRNIVSHEINPVLATNQELKAALAVPFKFEKKVVGGQQTVATNLFDIYKNYAIQAEKHLNISPHVEKINKFVLEEMVLPDGTKVAPLAKTNPNIADALLQYGKSISGRYGQAFTESWGWFERGISGLSNNVVISMLTYYPKSVANQVGALTGAAARVRPDRLIRGINSALTPEGWKLAMTESRVLGQRRMDVVFEDVFGGGTKILGELKHKGMIPLEATDSMIAVGAWNGGVLQAESMGLKGRKAYDWADEIVSQSQGSASAIDRSNFQRTMIGKALSGLQTFTIADSNLWMREIFGFGNKNKTLMQKGASLASVLAVGTAMNLFYRNVMGMSPPNPEPIEAFNKAKEEGASNLSAMGSVGKELATKYAPLVGSMAMGKTPFGPLGSLISDISSGNKRLVEAGMSLAGVPATNLLSKLYRTEPGMELRAKLEDLTTLPLAQRTKLTLPPMTVKEALLGRLDYPGRKSPSKWDLWLRERMESK